MDWTLFFSVVAAVCGIIALAISILTGLQTKQVYRPVLTFNTGIISESREGKEIINGNKECKEFFHDKFTSTLIYCASSSSNSETVFVCPYLLINKSKLPIFNITLNLEYSEKYAIREGDPIIDMINKNEEFQKNVPEVYKTRKVQIIGPTAQVRFTIPVLREGEPYIITDIVKFTNGNFSRELNDKNENYGINNKIAKSLKSIKKLGAFCVIDAILYSESCSPISRRIKLLWLDTNSHSELESLTRDAFKKIIWSGNMKPGFYWQIFWPFRSTKLKMEYGEAVNAVLSKIGKSNGRNVYIENPSKSTRQIVAFTVPPWDYYEVSSNLDDNDLFRTYGFRLLVSEHHLNRLRQILKRS